MQSRRIPLNKFIKRIFRFINKILEITKINSMIMILSQSNVSKNRIIPHDIRNDEGFLEIYDKCKNFSMTSVERMFSLYTAIIYVIKNKIPGDIVECGVWKGGSMMLSALTLIKMKDTTRKIFLYDTYEGMPEPTHYDLRTYDLFKASEKYEEFKKRNEKCMYAPLEEVKKNLYNTGYPSNNLVFVKGRVENTIPKIIPEKISILRLDTDWYESSYHVLNHLFQKLSVKGMLILDDYGHWKGAKLATDKYFQEKKVKIFLNRIDPPGRLGIKQNN